MKDPSWDGYQSEALIYIFQLLYPVNHTGRCFFKSTHDRHESRPTFAALNGTIGFSRHISIEIKLMSSCDLLFKRLKSWGRPNTFSHNCFFDGTYYGTNFARSAFGYLPILMHQRISSLKSLDRSTLQLKARQEASRPTLFSSGLIQLSKVSHAPTMYLSPGWRRGPSHRRLRQGVIIGCSVMQMAGVHEASDLNSLVEEALGTCTILRQSALLAEEAGYVGEAVDD